MEPTFYYAPGTGILSSRSGWGADDTQVVFAAGPVRESHQDRAAGTFYLFRNTWLAGTAKLGSHSGLAQDAIDHCTLTVDGQRQVQTQDGVKILRQEDNPAYTYAMADVAGAYQGQLSAFIREIFFLKPLFTGGPAFLLIADGYVPVNQASTVVFHLNTLASPLIGGTAFRSGQLFGQVIEPFPAPLNTETVTVGQDHLTYRVNLAGDATSHFLVAMEAAAANQLNSTLGSPYVAQGVQGIRCGTAFVAWLSGDRTTWSYLSQAAGPNYLIGSPNTVYQAPAGQLTSTAAGVLTFPGLPVGQLVTITKGTTPLPVPVPVPIPIPIPPLKSYTVSGTFDQQPDGTLVGEMKLTPK